jgi:Protein of unknown function (DUF3027)
MTDAQKFAYAALVAVTPADTIGSFTGETDEGDGVMSYRFETMMPGYPGWNWTATIAQLQDAEPTIVETELTPAEGALLAPDWIPWSDRMDDYRAAQAALGETAAAEPGSESVDESDDSDDVDDDDESDNDDEADDDESDDDDDDDFGSDTLHSGDLDGVDIDELDVSADAADELDLPAGGVDERDETETEADGAGEEPPVVPARRKRACKEQQNNQGE